MKLGQTAASAAAAYNQYEWPTTTGTAGQQITIAAISGGVTTLVWGDPDQIPWTLKGQLVVGTGVNTQTLLNVGTNGQILIADSASASGLAYSSNYVSTTGATGVANMPAGSTGTRPATPSAGGTRYNSTTTSLEFWNGTSWETVASSGTNSFVEKTSDTGSAVMPAGTTLQRDAAPTGGFLRFNSTTARMEFYNGTAWQSVASSSTGVFVEQTLPTAPAGATANAVIPAGTTAQRQTAPASAAGNMRYNSTTASLEYFDGANWVGVKGGIPDLGLNLNATNSLLKASTPVTATPPTAGIAAGQAIDGSMYWDSQYGAMFVRYADGTSTQWVMVNGNNVQTGTLNFPDTPVGGNTYAAPNGLTYTYDGTKGVWTCPAGGVTAASLAEAAAGTIITKFLSPGTGVPKNAAGMTGAAIMPSGTDAQRAAITPLVVGMQRFNTTTEDQEVYTGATLGWRELAWSRDYDPVPTDLVISANTTLSGSILCRNLTINSGVTVTVDSYGLLINCTGTATINGSINADFAGGLGNPAAAPSFGAGQGRQDFEQATAGWNGPGVNGRTYSPSLYLGGSAPLSSYSVIDASTIAGGYTRTEGSAGGGFIAVVAEGAINVTATSTLSARGQDGGGYPTATGTVYATGMSGGSGGTVILDSNKSLTMAGTINVSGGAGGTAGCAGVGCSFGLGGGQGGGGGLIILQAPVTVNTGTTTLTGGAGGIGINGGGTGVQFGASSGGGNGGKGGAVKLAGQPVNGNAGSVGVLVFSGSPL